MYAAWWDRVSKRDAKARLAASVERYIAAIAVASATRDGAVLT